MIRKPPPQPLPNEIGRTLGDRDIAESWSMVDDTLIFLTLGEARNIWAVSVQGNEPPELVKMDQFGLDETHLSPDGRWLAYTSTESGRSEIYLEPFRQSGERVRVSVDGGGQPKWRGDSKELFMLHILPNIVDNISKVIADNLKIEKLVVMGNGGIPHHVGDVTSSVVTFLEQIKNATGVDLTRIVGDKKVLPIKKELE